MNTSRTRLCVAFSAVIVVSGNLSVADDAGHEFFEKKIRPVLVDYCYECHSSEADEAAGGLRVDTKDGLQSGGETGPAVVPEDLKESLLLSAIEYRDLEMPPDEMLEEAVIEDFRKWIRMGAPDPRDEAPSDSPAEAEAEAEADNVLWSLQPVTVAPVPTVTHKDWPVTDVDRFVLAKLESAELQPSPPASPEVLLRRAAFDLTGLPPSVHDVDSFSASPGEDAFAEMVDQLLQSPQFGERWARHWLDVVRYGESAGSSRDVLMLYSWRYRDYVIDAFNADLPYDQFLKEQIAGDLLPSSDPQIRRKRLIATGVLAIGSKSLNGGNVTLDTVDDQIDVIGKAVLGLTISCARCHDHKFDPVPTADYYSLAGIFRNTETFYGGSTNRPKNLNDQLKVYLPLSENTDETTEQLKKLTTEFTQAQKKHQALQRRVAALQKQLPKNWKQQLAAAEDSSANDSLTAKQRRQIETLQQTETAVQQQQQLVDKLQQQLKPLTPEFAFAVQDNKTPKDWPIQVRGERGKSGDMVPRGFLSCVNVSHTITIPDHQSGRLQLAEWLTQPDHPLTPRVIVNRVWQHLFGKGLVDTVNNFGTTGSQPSHPLLLDYLAHRFVYHHQWSIKSLIREIVLSRVYQQSSALNEAGWNTDPANRMLWRANRRRLEAEAIRDAMLDASGTLDRNRPLGSLVQEIGEGEVGRNINTKPLERPFPYRSVYLPIIRGLLPEMLKVFDFPEPSNPAAQRMETNVPTQSLFLLNSPFVTQQAAAVAVRVKETASDNTQRIEAAWRMCLSRRPTAAEVEDSLRFINQVKHSGKPANNETDEWQLLCQSVLASAEFRFID